MTPFDWKIELVNSKPCLTGDCINANGEIVFNQGGANPKCEGVTAFACTLTLMIDHTSFEKNNVMRRDIFCVATDQRDLYKNPLPDPPTVRCGNFDRVDAKTVRLKNTVPLPPRRRYSNYRVQWWYILPDGRHVPGDIDPKIINGPPASMRIFDLAITVAGIAILTGLFRQYRHYLK